MVHSLERLAYAGVSRVAVVAEPPLAVRLQAVLADGSDIGVQIGHCEVPAGTDAVTAIMAARRLLPEGPVVVLPSELLLIGDLTEAIGELRDKRLDALVVAGSAEDAEPARRRRFERGRSHALIGVELVEGPRLGAAAAHAADAGSSTLEDLAAALVSDGWHTEMAVADGAWSYEPGPDALLEVHRLVLDDIGHSVDADSFDDVDVQGRALVDPSARIRSSVIRGPVVIGPGVQVKDSFVGPYTCLGTDVILEGAEIDHSVVHPGAQIRNVGQRIEASVIGPGAIVRRTFRLPRALHLHVGEGARVTLS